VRCERKGVASLRAIDKESPSAVHGQWVQKAGGAVGRAMKVK